MSDIPKSCSDCGKCTIGSKECIGCPNFKPYEIALQKAADLFCATIQRVVELLTELLPPLLDVTSTALQALVDTYFKATKAVKSRASLPRPNYKEKTEKV